MILQQNLNNIFRQIPNRLEQTKISAIGQAEKQRRPWR